MSTNNGGLVAASATGPAHRLERVGRMAGVGWFEVDADRNLVGVSPELERITGFSADEVLGKPCLSVFRCRECLRDCGVFRYGKIADSRLGIFRKDGQEIEVVRSAESLRDEAGNITGAFETVRLADNPTNGAERLDSLMASLGRMYVVTDANLRVLMASPTLAEVLGRSAESVHGTPVDALFGDGVFGPDGTLRAILVDGRRREGWGGTLLAADGRRIPVSLSVGPIPDGSHCGEMGARVAIMIRPDGADEPDGPMPTFAGIVGRSAAMQRIFRLIELLHDNDATILITGESGTGKELVARALHAHSARAGGPFVAVNCAALPADLLESELFGHVRGAFTSAVRDRAGRFELADGGTLFLDEIGDLAPALQAKLLRVLQDRAFERVGDSRTRTVDVRVIAATHMDLGQAVADRRFRDDLYYRLRVVPIHVPPLRDRRDDLHLLIPHLLHRIGRRRGRALRLAPDASEALTAWSWPGNVRELENALEYATALCEGQTIHLADLPPGIGAADHAPGSATAIRGPWYDESIDHGRGPNRHARGGHAPALGQTADPIPGLTLAERDEITAIRAALERTHYRRDRAAEQLGISRTTLWRKMKQYRL